MTNFIASMRNISRELRTGTESCPYTNFSTINPFTTGLAGYSSKKKNQGV